MGNPAVGGLVRATARVPRLAAGVTLEAGWVAAHALMYPLGLLLGPAPPPRGHLRRRHSLAGLGPEQRGLMHAGVDTAARPVLLVHGIIDNHSIFTLLGRTLRRRGFADVSWFDYGLLTSDVRRAAADLGIAIERLVSRSGYDQVSVVGHSLGGLIARYYIQRMDGHQRVQTLVTLGTPHQGTALARVGQVLPLVGQLTPESSVLQELAGAAPGVGTRFVSFFSDLDQLIVPSWRARIDHPDLDARNVEVPGLGHLSLPHDRGVAFRIAAVLAGAD